MFDRATNTWNKVFKNGSSKICGRQPLKNLKVYGLLKADHTPSNLLKAAFHKFYLFCSWILCPTYMYILRRHVKPTNPQNNPYNPNFASNMKRIRAN